MASETTLPRGGPSGHVLRDPMAMSPSAVNNYGDYGNTGCRLKNVQQSSQMYHVNCSASQDNNFIGPL